MREFDGFDQEEADAWMAAEQQKDMEERHQWLQMTVNQLYRHVATGMTGSGDLASIALIARELQCTVPEVLTVQPTDYPLSVGGTD